MVSTCLVTGAVAEEQLTINGISVNKQNVYPGETVRVNVSWTNNTGYDLSTTVICSGRSTSGFTSYEQQLILGNSGTTYLDVPVEMSAALAVYDIMVYSGDRLLSKLDGAFAVDDALIEVSNVTPSESAPVEVFAGDTVRVSFRYSSHANTTAGINIGDRVSNTISLSKSTSLGTATADLMIPDGLLKAPTM